MGFSQQFARNLVRLRESKGLTRHQAAEAIGISYDKLWFYESGKVQPKLEVLVKICETYEYRDIYAVLTKVI